MNKETRRLAVTWVLQEWSVVSVSSGKKRQACNGNAVIYKDDEFDYFDAEVQLQQTAKKSIALVWGNDAPHTMRLRNSLNQMIAQFAPSNQCRSN